MTSKPRLWLHLDNGNGNVVDTVYVSTTPSDNTLTLTISVDTDTTLTAGTLVPKDQAGGGTGSIFYLDLSELGMTSEEFNALALDPASGWISKPYEGDDQLLAFAPNASVALSQGKPLGLSLTGFTLQKAPKASPAQLDVIYFRVFEAYHSAQPQEGAPALMVKVLPLPDTQTGQDLTQKMGVTLDPDQVENGGIENNDLKLDFTVGNNPVDIYASSDPNAQTVFTLKFIYAAQGSDGVGALMTPKQAEGVTISHPSGWDVEFHDEESPFWTLTPKPGSMIVGPDGSASIQFKISGVVTDFIDDSTVIYVSYTNVKDYNDGVYSVKVDKVQHIQILSFTHSPDPVLPGDTVTLSWQTNTDPMQLELDPDPPLAGDPPDLDPSATSYPATISVTTKFTLKATGIQPNSLKNQDQKSLTAHYSDHAPVYLSVDGVGDLRVNTTSGMIQIAEEDSITTTKGDIRFIKRKTDSSYSVAFDVQISFMTWAPLLNTYEPGYFYATKDFVSGNEILFIAQLVKKDCSIFVVSGDIFDKDGGIVMLQMDNGKFISNGTDPNNKLTMPYRLPADKDEGDQYCHFRLRIDTSLS